MKKLLTLLLVTISFAAAAQYTPNGTKPRWVYGVAMVPKDTASFTAPGDTSLIVMGLDSVIYSKHKGWWKAAGGSPKSYYKIKQSIDSSYFTIQSLDSMQTDTVRIVSVGGSGGSGIGSVTLIKTNLGTGLLGGPIVDSGMLSIDTAGTIPSKAFLSTALSWYAPLTSLDAKLNIADTGAMLSNYLNSTAVTSALATKLNIADTGNMLLPYPNFTATNALIAAAVSGKLNISDTTGMLSNYYNKTASDSKYYLQTNPAGYITAAAIAGKLNISDTTAMLNNYYNKTYTNANFVNTTSAQTVAGDKTFTGASRFNNVAGGVAINSVTNDNRSINALNNSASSPTIVAQNSTTGKTFSGLNTTGSEVFSVSSAGAIVGSTVAIAGGTSSQFLKADGSVDANTYLTSASITGKLNISDTAAMLLPHPNKTYVDANLATKQNTLSLTTSGTSGAATLVGATLNIPQYAGGTTTNSLTFGSGLQSGSFNGSSAVTIKADTGRTVGAVVTGGTLIKVRDSIVGILPAGVDMVAAQLTRSTTLVLTTSYANVTFDAHPVLNNTTILNHSTSTNPERILIGETGLYHFAWAGAANVTFGGATGTDIAMQLLVNGTTPVAGSYTYGLNSSADGEEVSKSAVVSLTAGDYVTLQAKYIGSSGTTLSDAAINVVRLKGAKGDVGATGATGGITTAITGILKGNGAVVSAATSGTDYSAGTSALGTGIVKSTTGTGALTIATGADLPAMTSTVGGAVPTPPNNTTTFLRGDGTFAVPTGGSGTVTSVAALTLGTTGTDLNSSVVNSTTTPVITLNVPDASATARGVVTTGTQTFAGLKSVQGTTASDLPTLGAEVLTTGTGTNWAGTNFSTGYTHTTGSVVALTSATAVSIGTTYYFTITTTSHTTGNVSISVGGITNTGFLFSSGTSVGGVTATTTAALTVTPSTDFNGVVTVSLKPVTASAATYKILSSAGTSRNEWRADGNTGNTFEGVNSGAKNYTGTNNTAFGNSALAGNLTGSNNIAIGYQALSSTPSITNTVAIGYQALSSATVSAAFQSVAVGYRSLLNNTIGTDNVAVGYNTGVNVAGSSFNTLIGSLAGGGITSGGSNTAVGWATMANNSSSGSTAIGAAALSTANGNNNTAIGSGALQVVVGSENTALGKDAGHFISGGVTGNTAGSNSIFIGSQAYPLAASQTNQIVMGYQTVGLGSNTTHIGNASTASAAIRGNLLLGTTTDAGTGILQATGNGFFSGNLTSNNGINGYTTTATAAGTTTLTVSSTYQQYFTGATTQTVVLPVATTLVNGYQLDIVNNSTGVVTVQTSGSNVVQALASNTELVITCINTAGGTGTASWGWRYFPVLATTPGITTVTTTGSSGSSLLTGTTLNIPTYTLAGLGGVSGSGTSGQVPYWNSTSSLTGSADFTWDNTNKNLVVNQNGPGYIKLGQASGTSGFMQSANSNFLFSSNVKYNGSAWVYDLNGYGAQFQVEGLNGTASISTAPTGVAAATATMTPRLFVTNAGRTLLGTALPTDDGISNLSVNSILRVSSSTSPPSILQSLSSNTFLSSNIYHNGSTYVYNNSGYGSVITEESNTGSFAIGTAPLGTGAAAASVSNHFYMYNAGRILMGTTLPTDDGSTSVQVGGAIRQTSVTNAMLKAGSTGILTAATAGTDYQAPITLTTTGTSGAATLVGNTLNIPNYATGGGGGTGTTTNPLTLGSGLLGTSFDGSAAVTAKIDTTLVSTKANVTALLTGYTAGASVVKYTDTTSILNAYYNKTYIDANLATKAPAITYTTNYIPFGQGTTTLNQSSNLTFNGTTLTAPQIVANASTSPASTTGAIAYGTLGYSDANHLLTLQGNQNNYVQSVIQNTNAGASASSDVIVANDNTTSTTFYGNFGMNSSGWAGSGAFNSPNTVYVSSTSGDLALGTTTANPIHFVVNGGTTDAMTISSAGAVTIPNLSTVGLVTNSAAGLLSTTNGTGFVKNNGSGVISYDNSTYQPLATNLTSISSLANTSGALTNNGTGTFSYVSYAPLVSPSFTTPSLGAATATSINGNTFTTGTYTLTGAAAKTLTFNNSLTLAGTDGTTMTFPTTSKTLLANDGSNLGLASQAIGDVLIASSTTAMGRVADVATGNALISGGVGVAPSFGKIGLTTHVSGTLPLANGGTNATTAAGALASLQAQAANTATTTLTAGATVTWTPVAGVSMYSLTPAQNEALNMGTVPAAMVGQVVYLKITTSGTTSFAVTPGTNILSATGALNTGTVTAKLFIIAFLINTTTSVVELYRTVAQ